MKSEIQIKIAQLAEKGWTLAAIADELGVTSDTVELWRAGRRNPTHAKAVSVMLDVVLKKKQIPKQRRYAKGSRQKEKGNNGMEAKLFSHSETGGFHNKEEVRSFLDKNVREQGIYLLARVFDVPSNSLAFFEMEGAILGCAVVNEAVHEMTEADRDGYREDTGKDWKALLRLDLKSIWVWRPEQDVKLKEVGIRFLPGPPMPLTALNVLRIFQLVARRSS